MTLVRLAMLSPLVLIAACVRLTSFERPCGGNGQVDAEGVLPDTGLGAGGTVSIFFNESEQGNGRNDAYLSVEASPPANMTFADSTARIRVIADDGRVFLDRQSTPAYLGSWYASDSINPGPARDDVIPAFQASAVAIEFSSSTPPSRMTRLRPSVQFAGRFPVAVCD